MADLYRARDLRDGRLVALKVPRLGYGADPVLFDCYKREEALGRRLHHLHIVAYLDQEAKSRPYLVLELLEGRDLRDLLRERGRCSYEDVRRWGGQVCEALAYLHGQGIIYHDCKPENLFLSQEGTIKLLDLGLAEWPEAGLEWVNPEVSAAGRPLGTPAYVAPEVLRGVRTDPRSDLYSLGVVLYEALTGKLPFRGRTPEAMAWKRLYWDPIAPRCWQSQFHPEIQEILLRALERDPRRRYQTAEALALDLAAPERIALTPRAFAHASPSRWRAWLQWLRLHWE
jgi:serine/threonine-protein kinase